MAGKTKKTRRPGGPMVFDMTSNQCVWARAGVVQPMPCMNAFNCLDCPFDQKMKGQVASGRAHGGPAPISPLPTRGEDFRTYERVKCRHMLSGRVVSKYCVFDYQCSACEFNQQIDEETLALGPGRVEAYYAGGFALARHYYYHRGHTWARVEYGGRVRVGLDDFAVRLVGPLDRIEMPGLGREVVQGSPGIVLTREGRTAALSCPMEGLVVALNARVLDRPALAHEDPYGEGWLMLVEPRKLKTCLRNLLFGEEGAAWIEDESRRLAAILTEETEYPLAATGGRAMEDIYGQARGIGWDRLVGSFLTTG
ncbi:MAG: glycine cleavage system protein H [Proteobacteria bacterium]|nr:glycine cleavage system protein H [Pseudomonadota bacterium]